MDQVKLLLEEKKILILQIEELRDANEEVKDKLGNWQVQAHAKEVRERSTHLRKRRCTIVDRSNFKTVFWTLDPAHH